MIWSSPSAALHRHTSAIALRADAEDWRDHVVCDRYKYQDGHYQHDVEHLPLIFVARGPEVDEDDANAIEAVEEDRRDQCQRDEADRPVTENSNSIVVDRWAEADERDVYNMHQQKEQDA